METERAVTRVSLVVRGERSDVGVTLVGVVIVGVGVMVVTTVRVWVVVNVLVRKFTAEEPKVTAVKEPLKKIGLVLDSMEVVRKVVVSMKEEIKTSESTGGKLEDDMESKTSLRTREVGSERVFDFL